MVEKYTVVVPGLAGVNTTHTSRDTAEQEAQMWADQGHAPTLVPILVPAHHTWAWA